MSNATTSEPSDTPTDDGGPNGIGAGVASGSPAAPPQPADSRQATGAAVPAANYAALRTGWIMAEVRGSLRKLPQARRPTGGLRYLPLNAADERSAAEKAIEAVAVLSSVVGAAMLDVDVTTLTGERKLRTGPEPVTASQQFRYLTWGFLDSKGWGDLHQTLDITVSEWTPPSQGWWKAITDLLWVWDAKIQDTLAARPFGTSSCYQLSRGLAEVYWALDPNATGGPESWAHLLGANRLRAICELLDRLSPVVIPAETAGAIKSTLGEWHAIATEPDWSRWRSFDKVTKRLKDQIEAWRDLLLMAADPGSFADIGIIARASRRSRHIWKFFSPELIVGAATSAGLGVSLYYLSAAAGQYAALGAGLSALGLTGSAASGTIKSISQDVIARMREASSQEAVTKMITRLPNQTEIQDDGVDTGRPPFNIRRWDQFGPLP
jgi:hypothetical protein